MVVKTFTKVSDLPTILFHKIGIGLQKSKFLQFSKFIKVQSTVVEILEKPYAKASLSGFRRTRAEHLAAKRERKVATSRSVNCKKITFLFLFYPRQIVFS